MNLMKITLSPHAGLENPSAHHDIMELLQRHTSTQPSTPIRLPNHILEQLIVNRSIFDIPRNAPQVIQRDWTATTTGKELVRIIYLGLLGIIAAGAQFRCSDGQERAIGDVPCECWVERGEDLGEFGGVFWGKAEGTV